MLGRDLAVIDLPEVSSSFVTGFEGFHIIAKGSRDPIHFRAEGKDDASYRDRV